MFSVKKINGDGGLVVGARKWLELACLEGGVKKMKEGG